VLLLIDEADDDVSWPMSGYFEPSLYPIAGNAGKLRDSRWVYSWRSEALNRSAARAQRREVQLIFALDAKCVDMRSTLLVRPAVIAMIQRLPGRAVPFKISRWPDADAQSKSTTWPPDRNVIPAYDGNPTLPPSWLDRTAWDSQGAAWNSQQRPATCCGTCGE